jgi:hypothetical protein
MMMLRFCALHALQTDFLLILEESVPLFDALKQKSPLNGMPAATEKGIMVCCVCACISKTAAVLPYRR